MKKLVIAAGGIVIVAGFFLYRHFVINSIMDGPFMENISPDESETETVSDPESASDPEQASVRSIPWGRRNSLHIRLRTRIFSTPPTVSWSSPGPQTDSSSRKASMANPPTAFWNCCRTSQKGSYLKNL